MTKTGKSRVAFAMLQNIWATKNIRMTTKLRIILLQRKVHVHLTLWRGDMENYKR
jgi:hypothetical protein